MTSAWIWNALCRVARFNTKYGDDFAMIYGPRQVLSFKQRYTQMIIFREALCVTHETLPRGYIVNWPMDMELPPGTIWLRNPVYDNGKFLGWSLDYTTEAKKVMEEIINADSHREGGADQTRH